MRDLTSERKIHSPAFTSFHSPCILEIRGLEQGEQQEGGKGDGTALESNAEEPEGETEGSTLKRKKEKGQTGGPAIKKPKGSKKGRKKHSSIPWKCDFKVTAQWKDRVKSRNLRRVGLE